MGFSDIGMSVNDILHCEIGTNIIQPNTPIGYIVIVLITFILDPTMPGVFVSKLAFSMPGSIKYPLKSDQ
jgi:hypothetical protein